MKLRTLGPIFFLVVLMQACIWPPVVFHESNVGNQSMVCFKKACRKETRAHNKRKKIARERIKEREAKIAAGDTLEKPVMRFGELMTRDEIAQMKREKKKEDVVSEEVKWSEEQTFILDHIYFETNSAVLKETSYDQLDELAAWLQENAETIIEIGGHTDNSGDENTNLKLSKQRVKAVGYYLIKEQGIERNRLIPKGYGSSKPIASNATEEGKKTNRRVEFSIIKK